MPWDDDLDVLVEHRKRGGFLRELLALSRELPHGSRLEVSELSGRPGTMKVFAAPGYPPTLLNPHLSWPFVDVSFYGVVRDESEGANYMVSIRNIIKILQLSTC